MYMVLVDQKLPPRQLSHHM